jgi:hypothetical protein
MAPQLSEMGTWALQTSWDILSQTHRAMKSLQFDAVFPTLSVMKAAMHQSPIQFASGLMQTLSAPLAPTIQFFKQLPIISGKLWAVYALVMEKADCQPRLYIGSGCHSTTGVASRMQFYDRRVRIGKSKSGVPQYVEASLQEGFCITHKGFLAWCPLPRPAFQYFVHAFFLVLECTFTLVFWAMKSRTKDYYMPRLCPWPIDSFTYDGLCSHFSINEGLATDSEHSNLSPDEFDALVLERKKAKSRMYIANKGEGVHAANTRATIKKALEEQRYKCDVCVLTFPCRAKLQAHLKLKIHLNKTLGATKITKAKGRAQMTATQQLRFCDDCQHLSSTSQRHTVHMAGVRHAAKLKILAASSSLA